MMTKNKKALRAFLVSPARYLLYNIDMPKLQYCSIDLEFTGFDPETEQILEIGFAFFDVTKDGLVIGEKWSQVFKPTIDVHPKILGLTGISQKEIDGAPDVSEFKEFLNEKLGKAVLVAHNPVLDVKFLEQAGIKLSGKVIDTLELVQFLLPTHHSYNLENLMHYFNLKHQDSHRALGDSISTILLLEKLMQIHSGLPDKLKLQLRKIYEQAEFEWSKLLTHPFPTSTADGADSLAQTELATDTIANFDQQIVIDPKHFLHESRVANSLHSSDQPSLLVLPDKTEVLRLWRAGLVEGIFQSADLFSAKSFAAFMKTASTQEELRFCLKVLVWQHSNWQTKTVLDLNLSFFGGQFRTFIVNESFQPATGKIAACDYETFTDLAEQDLETNRQLVICDLQRFERYLTFGSKERLSWNYFTFVVKSIYNPETSYGNEQLSTQVVDTLAAVDLFFGLVQIMLRQNTKRTDYISLSDLEVLQPVYYHRLVGAAANLSEKLKALGDNAEHERLIQLGDDLTAFFELVPNQVKWVELSDENVILHSQPIRIEQLAKNLFDKYHSVKLTNTVSKPEILLFLVERLGFNPEIAKNTNDSASLDLIDLFVNDIHDLATSEHLDNLDYPIVILFPSPAAAKDFYKQHYQSLKDRFKLYSQEYSGSGNKIFRNFRISPKSLLLATSNFVNKQKYSAPAGTLIYTKLPQVDAEQPYFQALYKEYSKKYPELEKIISENDLLLNLKQLHGAEPPKIIRLKYS